MAWNPTQQEPATTQTPPQPDAATRYTDTTSLLHLPPPSPSPPSDNPKLNNEDSSRLLSPSPSPSPLLLPSPQPPPPPYSLSPSSCKMSTNSKSIPNAATADAPGAIPPASTLSAMAPTTQSYSSYYDIGAIAERANMATAAERERADRAVVTERERADRVAVGECHSKIICLILGVGALSLAWLIFWTIFHHTLTPPTLPFQKPA